MQRAPWNTFYILWQHAEHTRVAMKSKLSSMAHAVRVGLSEMQ